jgi:hypothetical protein
MLYLSHMRDAYTLRGTSINYNDKDWVIGETYYVPGNLQIYVQLKDGIISMNVRLIDIIEILVNGKQ